MRILYALHKFLPRYFSGTETYTYSLAREMQKRGHEVQVFCAEEVEKGPDDHIRAQEDTYHGLAVHRINFNRKKTPDIIRFAYNNPIVADHFHSFLSLNQPDIVHITSFLNLSAAIIDPLKACSIPAIFTATDFWCFCPKSTFLTFDLSLCKEAEARKCLACISSLSPFYHRVLKRFKFSPTVVAATLSLLSQIPKVKENPYLKGKRALEERPHYLREKLAHLNLVITPTPFLREFFIDSGFPAEKVLVSGFGLNTDWVKPHAKKSPGDPLQFGYIGMLAQLKGVDLLIRSFSKISLSHRACLNIYGDESHFPHYAQWLEDLAGGSPDIRFQGTFPPEKLGEILAEIDVLVVPSIWYENTPLIIHSAFAAGVPVIGSNVPGIAELITDNLNGLLFSRGDEKILTHSLERFFEEPQLLPRLRESLPSVKDIKEHGEELEGLYQSLEGSGARDQLSADN